MKKTESEQTVMPDAELDTVLAQMADEVPPMPADFHDRWMNAVRADAQNAVSREGSAPDRTVIPARWTRIFSIAAVFVFLIGGTLLFRSTKKSMSVPYAAERREAAETAAAAAGGPAAEVAAENTVGAWTGEAEEAADEGAAAEESAAAEVSLQDAAVQGAAKSAGAENADKAYAMKTAGAAQNSLAVSVPAESAEKEADDAAEVEEYDAASAFEAAEEASAEMMPTPEPTTAPTPVTTAALTEAPVPAEATGSEQTGFLQAAGAFFTDMGDFLLAALPYLAVLAVPAAAALVVRRKKSRRF